MAASGSGSGSGSGAGSGSSAASGAGTFTTSGRPTHSYGSYTPGLTRGLPHFPAGFAPGAGYQAPGSAYIHNPVWNPHGAPPGYRAVQHTPAGKRRRNISRRKQNRRNRSRKHRA